MNKTESKQSVHPVPRRTRRREQLPVMERDPIPIKIRKGTRERIAEIAISYRIPLEVRVVVMYPNGISFPECPRCKETIEREYMRFCDRCGQKLGWKNFDHAVVLHPFGWPAK